MINTKQLWMLVGGNGAGKTTFYNNYLKSRGIAFVNADNIAKTLDQDNPERLSYKASKIAEHLRKELLNKEVSFCFESVFSHHSKIDFMAEAKALGYEIILVFIHVEHDEINQARVIQRVAEGGHNVPPEKIKSRIPRTLNNIKRAIPLADQSYILDNSLQSNPYQQIVVIEDGIITTIANPLPLWAKDILKDYIG